MIDAAIIQGSLIDVRNAGQHKEVILKIAVPAELAMRVLDAFGWPTAVNPVSVAVARLVAGAEASTADRSRTFAEGAEQGNPGGENARLNKNAHHDETASPSDEPAPRGTHRRGWSELSPAQQAGIRCNEPAFWRFLTEDRSYPVSDAEDAADFVRTYCNVSSRSNILRGNDSGHLWQILEDNYRSWLREPELVG